MTADDLLTSVPRGWRELVARMIRRADALDVDLRWQNAQSVCGELLLSVILTGPAWSIAADLINDAERQSATTCEECGRPGHARSTPREVHTLCEPCAVLSVARPLCARTKSDEGTTPWNG